MAMAWLMLFSVIPADMNVQAAELVMAESEDQETEMEIVEEELMLESEGRYYPKDKFKALVENYFDSYKGRLYEILRGGREDATH